MLPPFIIDQIRKREEQERARKDADQPRLELPIESYRPAPSRPTPGAYDDMPGEDYAYREDQLPGDSSGVVIIQF